MALALPKFEWLNHHVNSDAIYIHPNKWPIIPISGKELAMQDNDHVKIKDLITFRIEMWRIQVNELADEMRRDLENWKP